MDQIKFGGVSEALYGLKSSSKFVTSRRFSRLNWSVITLPSYGLDQIKFGGVSEALYGLRSSPKFVTSRRFSRLRAVQNQEGAQEVHDQVGVPQALQEGNVRSSTTLFVVY